MDFIHLIVLLGLAQYVWFGIQVGGARGRSGIKAPAMSGDPGLERRIRVHYNTLELLVVFIPSIYIFALYAHQWTAVALGALYLVGRFVYARSYVKDPASREIGFGLSFLPIALLLVGAIGGIVWHLIKSA